MNQLSRAAVAITIVALLGGCGGNTTATPGVSLNTTPAPLSVSIKLPPHGATPASSSRAPMYVSTAIQSAVFVLTAVSPDTGSYTGALPYQSPTIPLTVGSANCVNTAGVETCTANITAPAPATDVWTVYTYGTATPIVGTTTPLSIYVGLTLHMQPGANYTTVSTWGVPASLAFSPASASNVAANVALTGANALATSLQVLDASGATIIGGDNFSDVAGNAATVAYQGCASPYLTSYPAAFQRGSAAALGTAGAGSIGISYNGAGTAGAALTCSASGPNGLSATYTVNLSAGSGNLGVTIE